mmetsp:Transcript_67502/g.126091  ORF Transcript_67502/g.126091 Transcript_67502/m.126091 type:complete len:252 (-) Transcript_67502:168-923(-)
MFGGSVPVPTPDEMPGPGMVVQDGTQKELLPDIPRMVYVGNIPWRVQWQDLKDHMKQAGTVEFTRILTLDGTEWGRSRGVGYVRYSTEEEAQNAVATLNGTELMGRQITVDPWTGGKPRDGFSRKGMDKGFGKGYPMKGGFYGFKGKGWGKSLQVHGDQEQMVYVGNIPWKMQWQDLKDHMKTAGTVEFVKMLTEDGTDWGRSRGVACVRYSSAAEAERAVSTLNNTEIEGRKINVDKWNANKAAAELSPA